MKKFIKDMNSEEIKKCLQENNKFYNLVYNDMYESDMECQYEESKLMFRKDHYKYIEYHDNYSSFFLTLINWQQFIDNLEKDYLCQDGIALYNEIIELKKEYENISLETFEEEERYYFLEGKIETMCKDLLEICENQLHEYEKADYSFEDLIDYVMNSCKYEEFYIIASDYVLYHDSITCFK